MDRRHALQLIAGSAAGLATATMAGTTVAEAAPATGLILPETDLVTTSGLVIPGAVGSASLAPKRFRQDAACRAAIGRVRRGRGVTFGVGIHDSMSGRVFIHDPYAAWEMASTVKVDLLLGVLRRAQAADRPLTARERRLARSMIISSDNPAASRLWAANGGAAGMRRLWRRIGLDDMRPGARGRWGLTRTSVRNRLRLLGILVDGHPAIDAVRANEVIWLMRDVRSGQRWGVQGAARAGEMCELKNGWLPRSADRRRWIVNTMGRVHGRFPRAPGGRVDLRMVVFSRGHASLSAGAVFTEEVLKVARRTLRV